MAKTLQEILPGVVEFRRRLHRCPEIAGKEFRTMRAIRERLAAIPELEVLPPFLETDTVAMLRGARPGVNVTLRADIDALTVCEPEGRLPWASEVPGMMHACGHDAHAAILTGVAEYLASRRDEFAGSVRFVWQPGEENQAMARPLIAAGAIDDPAPAMVAALHVAPGLPVGTVGIRRGAVASSCCHFSVGVEGLGGHGSRPDLARNPVVAIAAIVTELQSVVGRRVSPMRSGVVSVCEIHGGRLDNVIPGEAGCTGTLRALDNETAGELEDALREVVENVGRIHRVKTTLQAERRYLATVNTPAETELAIRAMGEAGVPTAIEEEPWMSSEDFSYFLDRAPGVMLHLGNGEDSAGLHSPDIVFREEALGSGILALASIALARLAQG